MSSIVNYPLWLRMCVLIHHTLTPPPLPRPRYLVADYSLRCDVDEWRRRLPFAIFMVIFFVIGVPLLLLILLVRYRAVIKKMGRAIDESEVEAVVLKKLGETIDIDKARALYAQVDVDHNGSIDFVEFATFWLHHIEGEGDRAFGGLTILAKKIRMNNDDPDVVKSLVDKVLAVSNDRVGNRRSIRRESTDTTSGTGAPHNAVPDVEDAIRQQEVNASTETKGAAEETLEDRPEARKIRKRTSLVAEHILNLHQEVTRTLAEEEPRNKRVILASELAVVEEDGIEMMLGVLWMNYKPEYYFFDM